jgi:polysaccharide pyruvyl transferase WcaK-like protein
MEEKLHILVADYVPLANKGEEAIVCGIEDLLSRGRPIALGLFDNVPEVTQRGNITVFPREWLFRFEGNSSLSGRRRLWRQVRIALELRLGISGPLGHLTSAGPYRPLADFFDRAQYVLVGHDGVFGVESCGIIHLAKRHGKRVGILGASTGLAGGRFYKAWLYRRAMAESDFCIFREGHSCASMKSVSRQPAQLLIGPDPAFAMQPAPARAAREILDRCESCRKARQHHRPVVAVTALEKGRIFAGFRHDLPGPAKQQAHARYWAAILDALIAQHQAFVLFLPHSVEETGNDVVAAQHVREQMRAGPDDAAILDQDCGARLLKSLIRECDFLVGERTHSLIAAVSVGTPFAALTNRQDTRTHGIIGDMCRCEGQMIDIDVTGEADASSKVSLLFEQRGSLRQSLGRVQEELAKGIQEMARVIEGRPGTIRSGE